MYDILKDIEIRTNVKKIVLKHISHSDSLMEAIHTKTLDTKFLKLYAKLTNLKDQESILKLYHEYEKEVIEYLKTVK